MTQTFKKYSSIENHYQNKFIERFVAQKPELLNMKYHIEEKIHGSNFQVSITSDDVQFGRRVDYLVEGEKFYGYKEVMAYTDLITATQMWIKDKFPDSNITLYGELYGPGVQSEVFYGDQKEFCVFDITKDGVYMSPGEVRTVMALLGHEDKLVPLLTVVGSLEEALEYDVIFDSVISGKVDNKAEGIVIKPDTYVERNDGKRFIVKKKNPKFKENEAGKVKKAKTDFKPSELQLKFAGYVNDNRVAGVMSKYGEIDEPKQIGQYLKYVFADALEDFQKENEEYEEMTQDQFKEANKIMGKLCAPMIQKFL